MLKRIKHHIRTYFLTGLLVVIPVGLTFNILQIAITWADGKLALLPPSLHPDTYLPFPVPGLGLMITLMGIMFIGVITTNVVGRWFVGLGEKIVDKIPFFRSIYLLAKQVLETIFNKDKESFKKVIMVEYPRRGLYSIGFVTGIAGGEIQAKTSGKVLNIFIPTSPNPTSGYLIMIPEEDTVTLDIDVETAFKLILSGGMVNSDDNNNRNDNDEK
ncbi:MAG: DUF502 domain-containing protein [Proteobacteria bacterium]|nr:DUF502 domain-containing protein [Pseudomonadota bacterium]